MMPNMESAFALRHSPSNFLSVLWCPLYATTCVDGPGSGPFFLFGGGPAAQAALGLLVPHAASCSCGPPTMRDCVVFFVHLPGRVFLVQ